MCLARVYLQKEGGPHEREVFLADVAWIEVKPDGLLLRDLFGKEKTVSGRISAVDFAEGVVTLAMPDE